jgi:hypothetical protein
MDSFYKATIVLDIYVVKFLKKCYLETWIRLSANNHTIVVDLIIKLGANLQQHYQFKLMNLHRGGAQLFNSFER